MNARSPHSVTDVPRGVGSWPTERGNHRARLRVDVRADAIWAHIPWRRHDVAPELKDIIVLEAATGRRVQNVAPVDVRQECGDLVFEPQFGPTAYDVYYLPFGATRGGVRYGEYLPAQDMADPDWLRRCGLTGEGLASGSWRTLPQARLLKIQALTVFDRFDPMEVAATGEETERLLAQHAGLGYLLFPEDRRHPIRMRDRLPVPWIQRGSSTAFAGQAQRGEFYALQVGVWAAREHVRDLQVDFGDLCTAQGEVIPARAWRCFNTGA